MPVSSNGQSPIVMMPGAPSSPGLPSFKTNKRQYLFLGLGAIILIMLLFIIIALITSSGKSTTQTLIGIAEEQTELVRVSAVGVKNARSADAKNLAVTTSLALQSSQQDTVAFLKKQGHKLSSKQLALKHSTQTDTTLNNAQLNNAFDDAFLQVMQSSLKTYQTDVKQAYDASQNKAEKAILASSYNGINTILSAQSTAANQ